MFAVLHSDINSPKSGFLHLTGQPYCKKSRSAKVKDGIIAYFLGTISLIDTSYGSNYYHIVLNLSVCQCHSFLVYAGKAGAYQLGATNKTQP